MSELGTVLDQLKRERMRLVAELRQLDQAIKALGKVSVKSTKSGTRRHRGPLSAAARKRIAAAQRARWAKFRAGRKGKAA